MLTTETATAGYLARVQFAPTLVSGYVRYLEATLGYSATQAIINSAEGGDQ